MHCITSIIAACLWRASYLVQAVALHQPHCFDTVSVWARKAKTRVLCITRIIPACLWQASCLVQAVALHQPHWLDTVSVCARKCTNTRRGAKSALHHRHQPGLPLAGFLLGAGGGSASAALVGHGFGLCQEMHKHGEKCQKCFASPASSGRLPAWCRQWLCINRIGWTRFRSVPANAQTRGEVPKVLCITRIIQACLWQASCLVQAVALHQPHWLDTVSVWVRKSKNTETGAKRALHHQHHPGLFLAGFLLGAASTALVGHGFGLCQAMDKHGERCQKCFASQASARLAFGRLPAWCRRWLCISRIGWTRFRSVPGNAQTRGEVPKVLCITRIIQACLWQASCLVQAVALHQPHCLDTVSVLARESKHTGTGAKRTLHHQHL